MEYLHKEYNCRLIFTAPYSPQTNGLTESYHKIIKTCLIKSLSRHQDHWVKNLEPLFRIYRSLRLVNVPFENCALIRRRNSR